MRNDAVRTLALGLCLACLSPATATIGCSGSTQPADPTPPRQVQRRTPRLATGSPSAPAMRLWPIRTKILLVPDDLAYRGESSCLPEEDPAFGGLFVGGPTRIVTLAAADRRIEAWVSCSPGEFTNVIWIYPAQSPEIRYMLSYVEAGLAVFVRNDWDRACEGATCDHRMSAAEQSFWRAEWKSVGNLLSLSEPVVALEAAVTRIRKSAAKP